MSLLCCCENPPPPRRPHLVRTESEAAEAISPESAKRSLSMSTSTKPVRAEVQVLRGAEELKDYGLTDEDIAAVCRMIGVEIIDQKSKPDEVFPAPSRSDTSADETRKPAGFDRFDKGSGINDLDESEKPAGLDRGSAVNELDESDEHGEGDRYAPRSEPSPENHDFSKEMKHKDQVDNQEAIARIVRQLSTVLDVSSGSETESDAADEMKRISPRSMSESEAEQGDVEDWKDQKAEKEKSLLFALTKEYTTQESRFFEYDRDFYN